MRNGSRYKKYIITVTFVTTVTPPASPVMKVMEVTVQTKCFSALGYCFA